MIQCYYTPLTGLCIWTLYSSSLSPSPFTFFFFFNDTATTEFSPLSLHDALPISVRALVEVEARLVAHAERHREPDAVFVHLDGRRPHTPGPAVSRLEPLEPSRPVLVLVEDGRSEEHTSELQSQSNLVCRLLLEKK